MNGGSVGVPNCRQIGRLMIENLKHVAELETVTACGHGSVSYANMGLCAGRKANYHRPFPFLQAKNNINHGHCQKSLNITRLKTNTVVFTFHQLF